MALALSPELVDGVRRMVAAGNSYCATPEFAEMVQHLRDIQQKVRAVAEVVAQVRASTEFLETTRALAEIVGGVVGAIRTFGEANPWLADLVNGDASTALGLSSGDLESFRQSIRGAEGALRYATLSMPARPREPEAPESVPPSPQLNHRCGCCDGPMLVNMTQSGADLDFKVFPFCVPCQEAWAVDPEYMNRHLRRFVGPKLTVIAGEGDSEGGPTGELHLVPPSDDADD